MRRPNSNRSPNVPNPPSRLSGLGLAIVAACLAAYTGYAQATIVGNVPITKEKTAAVMAKRYEIVSRGGALAANPPLAIIWIEGNFEPTGTPKNAVLAQENFVFHPSLLPVERGTTVAFPNRDEEYHNIFSYSPTKRFDLGRYMPNERPIPTQTFDKAGTVVLRCDVHEHMKAIILVIDSPHFVASDPNGNFRLEGLPEGDYVLKAWLDTKTTREKPVSITDGETLTVDF